MAEEPTSTGSGSDPLRRDADTIHDEPVARGADPEQPVTPPRGDRQGGQAVDEGRGRGAPLVAAAGGLAATAVSAAASVMLRQRRSSIQRAEQQRRQSALGTGALAGAGVVAVAGVLRAVGRAVAPRGGPAASELAVGDVMSRGAACVLETETLQEAARTMARLDVGALPVCGADNRLKGMITDRDIVMRAAAGQGDVALVTAGELARGTPVTITADASVAEALRSMSRHKVRRLPVLDGDTLVGVVSQADIATHVSDEEIGALVESISAAP